MFGHRFRSSGSQHSILRNVAPAVTAAVALLALLPQAWSATPTFTVANNVFPSTEIGKSTTQNVTLTVNTAVPITSIALGPNFTEYKLGAITGCTIDSSGNTIVAASSVCTIPVPFTPAVPGTASAPPPISRSAPLLVTDVEGGKPNGYSFALSGSATGAVFADINGDGHLDLLVNSIGQGTHIFLNDGHGHFTRSAQVLNEGRGGTSLALADASGTGRLDLYIANYRASTIMDAPGTRFSMRMVDNKPEVATINGQPLTDPTPPRTTSISSPWICLRQNTCGISTPQTRCKYLR